MTSQNDRPLAQLDASSSARHELVDTEIQEAILSVAAVHEGNADLASVMVALDVALADRGIGEQPRPWVEAVAQSIILGSPYVESVRTAHLVDDGPPGERERRDQPNAPGDQDR